jgi:hypothetical protein
VCARRARCIIIAPARARSSALLALHLLLYAVAAAVPKSCCLIVVHIYFVSGGRSVAD